MPHLAPRPARRGRRVVALASAAGLTTLTSLTPASALIAPAAPATLRTATATAHTAVTVTGPHMYDPKTKQPFPNASTVTVSQTTNLVNQIISVSWTNFTPSNNQHAAPPGYSATLTMYPVMIAECSGDSPGSSAANLANCYFGSGGVNLTQGVYGPDNGHYGPTNEAYAYTLPAGTGSASIQLETSVQNQGLNCSASHDCSLLILPAQGGYPGSPPSQPANCGDHQVDGFLGGDYATALSTFLVPGNANGGDTCAWNSRIVVPLHFAPTSASCGFSNSTFSVAGSPFMQRAMASWASALCHGRSPIALFPDNSVSEPEARSLFQAGAQDVALTTEPATGPSAHPYTYAPVGISAVAVAYWFDNQSTTVPYPTGLKLDPRLLAKELTQSYGYGTACTRQTIQHPPPKPPGCDPGVMHDPQDMLADPEFRQLNPHINVLYNGAPRAMPTVEQDSSDMTWEVTRWIAADQGATQFLRGQTDPYGEHLNTFYLGTQYPSQQFQSSDPNSAAFWSYLPQPVYKVAWYQSLNWWPGIDWTTPVIGQPGNYAARHVEPPGTRSLLAITDNPDAAAFTFPVMALENHAGKYVLPTSASMVAAVDSMTVSSNGITRDANTATSNPAAYPLTMVSYAMVPTGGISHAKAAKIAQWLDFVAGHGQVQGTQPGQLPAGYLPLPASLRQQTLKAAYEVLHQTGGHSSGPGGGGGNGNGSGSGKNGSGSNGSGSGKNASTAANGGGKVNASYSNPLSNAFARLVVPLLIVLGALLAVGGSSAVVFSKPEARAAVVTRWRRLQALTHRQPTTPEGK